MADEDVEKEEEGTQETAEEQAEEEAPKKEKKQKKVVRRRKTKKERENPLTMAVRLAVESGKVEFGGKAGISSALSGSAKLFIVAENAPGDIKAKVETYCKVSGIPVIGFEGSSMELGSVCGRPFPVSVLSVFEEGSSNILELAKKK
jgi:large subunit ribosomal protein L30e